MFDWCVGIWVWVCLGVGVLVSPDAVLTTASCLNLVLEHEEPTVRIHGESDTSFTISDVFFHPSVNFEMVRTRNIRNTKVENSVMYDSGYRRHRLIVRKWFGLV